MNMDGNLPIDVSCAVYPEIPIVTCLEETEAMVSIRFGEGPRISLEFFDVDVLRLLRGAVDEAMRVLAGRVEYIGCLPDRA
jgi:hypothetical protein